MKTFENKLIKQTTMNHTYIHKEHFENTQNGTHTSDTQQESMTRNHSDNIKSNKQDSEQWTKGQCK